MKEYLVLVIRKTKLKPGNGFEIQRSFSRNRKGYKNTPRHQIFCKVCNKQDDEYHLEVS